MKFRKLYSIKLRYVPNLGCFWFQLIDDRGCRPAGRPATVSTPARDYSKRYKSVTVGARNFTRYREELEGRGV